jgi:C4-dicarboxylate-specific signal transduction histidine kinase
MRSSRILLTLQQGSQFTFSKYLPSQPARVYHKQRLASAHRAGILKAVGRVLIGAVVVAIVAAILFYVYSQSCQSRAAAQAQQISEMGNRLNQLQQDNDQLKSELAKVQDEETKLNAQNTELLKAIGTFKATGKMPAMPAYPPK